MSERKLRNFDKQYREMNGCVAKNKYEYDNLQHMSFFNTKEEAKKVFGRRQIYIPVKIIFNPDKES